MRVSNMPTPKSNIAMWFILLTTLLGSVGAHAGVTDTIPDVNSRQAAGSVPVAQAPATNHIPASSLTPALHKRLPAVKQVKPKTSPYPENWIEPDMTTDRSNTFDDMENELRANERTAKPSPKEGSATPQTPTGK